MLRWGLVPSWADEAAIGNRMINARSESVASKPSFRTAFRHRRCLIPADGFFEWQKQGTRKHPYLIGVGDLFAFAGLAALPGDKDIHLPRRSLGEQRPPQ